MVLGINQVIGLFVVIISVVAYFTVKNHLIHNNDSVRSLNGNENVLFIGIASAQEHFEQRHSIRRTWLKLKSERLKYYFLVGNLFCSVPPRYRVSHLSCEEWKPLLNDDATSDTIFSTTTREDGCHKSNSDNNVENSPTGFSFILKHKITVHQLGIKGSVVNSCKRPIRLILSDAITKTKIITSTFSSQNNEHGDIIWNKIPKTVLPSGFEGMLSMVDKCDLEESVNGSVNLVLNDKSRIIKFLSVTNIGNQVTLPYLNNICTNIGFKFSIKDVDDIRNIINERDDAWSKWGDHVNKMSKKLTDEVTKYGDILLLNIVDVYHNLPLKMLQFYQWINIDEYEYVLKTDDDVFIDIPNVMRELNLNLDLRKREMNWWSCFRTNWPVHRAGKWRELHLNRTTYPTFPSGAGYILSRELVKYLNQHTKYLPSNIQGEDVAIGLWLEELQPKMHFGFHCHWSCSDSCQKNACNVIQLNPSEMSSVWKLYVACNNSLSCLCK